jgi:hypothetical protein
MGCHRFPQRPAARRVFDLIFLTFSFIFSSAGVRMKSQEKLYRPTPMFETAAKRCGLTSQRAMALGLLVAEAENRADDTIPKSWIMELFVNDFRLSQSDAAIYLRYFQQCGFLRRSGIRRRRSDVQQSPHRHAEFIVSESAKQKFYEFARSLG